MERPPRSPDEDIFGRGLWQQIVRGALVLLLAVLGTLAAQLAAIYLPVLQQLLSTQPLSFAELVIVVVASSTTFWTVEIGKLFRRRRMSRAAVA
jgi:Ca2+-transporting ATPase